MTYFSSKNGSKKALKICQKSDFFFSFFGKNLHLGPDIPQKVTFWENACSRRAVDEKPWFLSSRLHARPKMRFSTFWKNLLFSCSNYRKLCSRLHQKPILAVLRLSKKINKIITVFSKKSIYDVNMHIFAARGFQNGENEQLLGYYLCQDPKWVPKWSQNGPKRIQKGSKNLSKIWLFFFVFWKKLAFGPRHPSKSDILGTC